MHFRSFISAWRIQWQDLLQDSTYQCSKEDSADSIGYPDDLCHTPANLLIIQTQLRKTQIAYFSRIEAQLTGTSTHTSSCNYKCIN
jgi:hypothetical protein